MRTCKLIVLSTVFGVSLTALLYFAFAPQLHLLVHTVTHPCYNGDIQLPGLSSSEKDVYIQGLANDAIANDLRAKVRVFCFIPVSPRNLRNKALAVRDTWLKRCNKYKFFSSTADPELPSVKLEIGEGLNLLTSKVFASFSYVYEKHKDDADWFVKADDDSYIIVENLRYLLSHYKADDPLYFGHHYKAHVKQGYMSGGGGYVLSKEALRRLVVQGMGPKSPCRRSGGAEDAAIGRCLELLDVKPGLSLDVLDRETFHPFNLNTHFYGTYPKWYTEYVKYGVKHGPECCSEFTISYHFVDHEVMRIMHHLIYSTQVYGIKMGMPKEDAFKRT